MLDESMSMGRAGNERTCCLEMRKGRAAGHEDVLFFLPVSLSEKRASKDQERGFFLFIIVIVARCPNEIKWVGRIIRSDAHQGSFGGRTGFSY